MSLPVVDFFQIFSPCCIEQFHHEFRGEMPEGVGTVFFGVCSDTATRHLIGGGSWALTIEVSTNGDHGPEWQ